MLQLLYISPPTLFLLIAMSFGSLLSAMAQPNGLLIAGPMLGYTEHREVTIWLEVSQATSQVALRYWQQGKPNSGQTVTYKGLLEQTFNPLKIVVGGLDLHTTYEYEIWLNGKAQTLPYPLQFTSKELWEWRKPAPDFSFQIGSCLYVNDSIYDRPGKPYGAGFEVIEQMTQQPADFMLWLGDNTYLREADWSSQYGIRYRYQHTRRQAPLQPFWASRPHYAIWDDHDYGPNDSNLSYSGKEITLQAFQDYWCNKSYGEADNQGIYSCFSWSDADFFLLDNRYHRSDKDISDNNNDKTYLGDRQMRWLQNALLVSKATFKFIASGSQVINEANNFECMRQYRREYDELINFITQHRIEGVVFLSGDRHFSEILQYQPNEGYVLYDITASPLSANAFKGIADDKREGNNAMRVKRALCNTQNYIQISAKGEPKKRRLLITCYNGKGKEVFSHEINANDLHWADDK